MDIYGPENGHQLNIRTPLVYDLILHMISLKSNKTVFCLCMIIFQCSFDCHLYSKQNAKEITGGSMMLNGPSIIQNPCVAVWVKTNTKHLKKPAVRVFQRIAWRELGELQKIKELS